MAEKIEKQDYIQAILDEIGLTNEELQLELLKLAESNPQGRINRNLHFIKKLLNDENYTKDPEIISFIASLFDMIKLFRLLSRT